MEQMIKMKKNFVFMGEAGCGKSEIAVNLAIKLADRKDKQVHLFDLDQTKPLFRSRGIKQQLEAHGIVLHYEEQFYDTPTLAGGVSTMLRDNNCHVVLDIGGNANGARVVGCFSGIINSGDAEVFYVINPYLPWSKDGNSIEVTMSAIRQVSRIKRFGILSNPNLGCTTTAEEFLNGSNKVREILSLYTPVDGACVMDSIYEEVKDKTDVFLFPLHLYFTYPWNSQ